MAVTVGIIAKISGLDWLRVILWVAVIALFSLFAYGVVIWDFNIFIPASGTLVAIIGVLLIYREMNLKNRPYVCTHDCKIKKRGHENEYELKHSVTNCGNLPAREIIQTAKVIINEKETPIPYLGEPQEIYPDQTLNASNPDIKFPPVDEVHYKLRIDYKGIKNKTYWYEILYRLDLRKEKSYIIKVISG